MLDRRAAANTFDGPCTVPQPSGQDKTGQPALSALALVKCHHHALIHGINNRQGGLSLIAEFETVDIKMLASEVQTFRVSAIAHQHLHMFACRINGLLNGVERMRLRSIFLRIAHRHIVGAGIIDCIVIHVEHIQRAQGFCGELHGFTLSALVCVARIRPVHIGAFRLKPLQDLREVSLALHGFDSSFLGVQALRRPACLLEHPKIEHAV